MSTTVLYEAADGVATITLNRPDRLNTMTDELLVAALAALERAASDDAVKAVILTGAGRAFCAGGDLGAGLSWAAACDLRYAAERAVFTTAFVNAGLSGDFGGTWTLSRIVGPAKARELYLLGEDRRSRGPSHRPRVPGPSRRRVGAVRSVGRSTGGGRRTTGASAHQGKSR
jgi:2-(1,2-epoxy-1,2-dihydrophenyl)acetyl-CoA isomerase